MCRSIKTLRGLEPAATSEDVHAAALQFVRKISGYRKPSRSNAAAFEAAVDEITAASLRLLEALPDTSPRKPALRGTTAENGLRPRLVPSREVL